MSENEKHCTTGPLEISPNAVSLLIGPGPYRTAGNRVGRSRLVPGDRWAWDIADQGMTADVEKTRDTLDVCLALRLDEFGKNDWAMFTHLPGVVSVLVTPLVTWFVIDFGGMRCRAPLILNHDADMASKIRRLLCAERATCRLSLFGISGTTVRARKVGVYLDRLWELLAEAVVLKKRPDNELYFEALAEYAGVSTDEMFATAMRRHLQPKRYR